MIIRLIWAIDVWIGHTLVMRWLPDGMQSWWYESFCLPAGNWECRD